jgi:membrane protein implicated in regulation of membrane protease activity
MSKEQKSRRRLWPFMGLIAVTGMWGVSAVANGWSGANLSDDPFISMILGSASVASDIMKAVALFVVVGALANKRYVAAGVALVVFALCATWSLRSATYFASSFMSQHVAQRGYSKALEEQEMASLRVKQRRLEWLSGTDIAVDNPGKTQLQMLTQDRSSRANEFKQLSTEVEQQLTRMKDKHVTANADPLGQIFHLRDESVVLWSSLGFAVLLEIVSGVGFWMIAQARVNVPIPLSPPVGFGGRGFGGGSPPSSGQPPPASGKPVPAARNVVSLRSKQTEQLATKVSGLVADLYEGDPHARPMRISQIIGAVNNRLPKGKKVNKSNTSLVLMPALLDLNINATRRKKSGKIWVHGVKARGHVPQLRVVG